MSRTAVTLGLTHGGEWILIAAPDVQMNKQLAEFRSVLGSRSHPELAQLYYQESDGIARIQRLMTPEVHAEHKKNLDAQNAEAAKQVKNEEADAKKRNEEFVKARLQQHYDETEAMNKQIAKDTADRIARNVAAKKNDPTAAFATGPIVPTTPVAAANAPTPLQARFETQPQSPAPVTTDAATNPTPPAVVNEGDTTQAQS